MVDTTGRDVGLRVGLAALALVSLGFLALFLFGPSEPTDPVDVETAPQMGLLDFLTDAPTREAVEALKSVAPGSFAELDTVSKRAIVGGADRQVVSELVLEALFGQFRAQASAIKASSSNAYQSIVAELAVGLRALKASDSDWCNGTKAADFLAQNEADLVPNLLAQFPHGSAQYDWAMGWMTTILGAAEKGRAAPQRYARPGFRDEATLQQEGLALGSEQWALGLQIASFANSEGTSYAQMQEVIANMNVCDLGIAVETVSGRLPADVRGRIWSDLMPEIMIGNTPYVMYRVNDYFFIG